MANCQPRIVVPKVESTWVLSAWVVYRALVGIGMLCALLIASVFLFTQPIIAKNRQQAVEQAIYAVLPLATTYQEWVYDGAGSKSFELANTVEASNTKDANLTSFYMGYDSQQNLVGIALLAQGRGYQDRIVIMYGYSPEQQAIVGMQVLESRETPGLGDKIETDADFRQNFRQLDVSLSSESLLSKAATLKNAIEVTKSGGKTQPWQIDGITGATISSQAIGNILQDSTEQWLPLLYQNVDQFQKKSQQQFKKGAPNE